MGRILRSVFLLVILGGIGLAGYAYFGDLSPERDEIRRSLVLDAR